MSIDGAAAKILCAHHNNALSTTDAAGGAAFKRFAAMRELENERNAMHPEKWETLHHNIGGLALERWFLKTMVNCMCIKHTELHWPGTIAHNELPRWVVECCYGLKCLKYPMGLYFAGDRGDKGQIGATVSFLPLQLEPQMEVACGLFEFRELRFVLSLTKYPLQDAVSTFAQKNAYYRGWQNVKLEHHVKDIHIKNQDKVSQVMHFDWKQPEKSHFRKILRVQ